jgi:hypothetical protein
MTTLVPPIEEGVPLPLNASEAMPKLSPSEELNMRANVVKLMSDLTGQPLSPTKEDASVAMDIAKDMALNPQHRPAFATYSNETLAYLAGMVAQMNQAIVHDLAELKMYVVNKLIAEVERTKDPRIRVAALSKLGEVDGVDAFKRRTESTIKVQTLEEVEKELVRTLENLENKIIDVEANEVVRSEPAPDEEEQE